MEEPDYKIKICLLGEPSVGKTSLVNRYVNDKFLKDYKSTLGVNFLSKDLVIGGYGLVNAQIWDLGGQESFIVLRKMYLDGSEGALLVFDMTKKETLEKLNTWIDDFKKIRGEEGDLILLGNKSDLKNEIQVNEEEVKGFAEKNGIKYVITSAKTGENVENSFISLFEKILKRATTDPSLINQINH